MLPGLRIATHLSQMWSEDGKKRKVLSVGCGNGYEAVCFLKNGHDCYTVELYHPKVGILGGRQTKAYAQSLPFKDNEFDMYVCCEVMEHIPEELAVPILKEAKRVSKEVYFTIADRDDPPYDTHITVKSFSWWLDVFIGLGFKILNAQTCPKVPLLAGNVMVCQTWGDGTLIHAEC